MRAPDPANEAERLRALHGYRILDTPPEPAFDEFVRLAAELCGTPMSSITLVDRDRQWFKARLGLADEETSRDLSICAHAILEDGVFVVEDASRDARFAEQANVVGDPNIRFYAGAPLVDDEGHALGTLCVLDDRPRELSREQEAALAALSRAVMAQLELHRHNEELRRLDRLKDDFVSLITHELKTPLASITGFTEMLLDSELDDDQRRFVEVVERNGARLLSLVNDLLFLARSQAGGLELRPTTVDLARLAADAVESARPAAEKGEVALAVDLEPADAVGDPQRLGQVLDNLVSNAVKFTRAGGSVRVSVRPAARDAVLEVADTGVGIAPEDLPYLFDRFYRTPATTDVPGTGLGLAIVKAIVEAHDGTIAVASEPGTGTTVRVTLPRTP